jgi:hypothetical protein
MKHSKMSTLFQNAVYASQKSDIFTITKTSVLIQFREIIIVYFGSLLWAKYVIFFNVVGTVYGQGFADCDVADMF